MGLGNDYEWFIYEMTVNCLTEYLVSSHLEAAASDEKENIVFIPDKETGKLDVYLVGKENGIFTEYVGWTSDEFAEDPELIYTVIDYVLEGFKGAKSVGENLKEMNPNLMFIPYPEEDYENIYDVMKRE